MLEKSPLIFPFGHKKSRRRVWFKFLVIFLVVVFFAVGFLAVNFWQGRTIAIDGGEINLALEARKIKDSVSLAPALLGYKRPVTYLVLFLNNTEIRPGGGFIGSYALVKADKGKLEILETRGSENLDWEAPSDFKVPPPEPLKLYIKQDKWYFRDSNWSPDFPVSAKTSQRFYRFEGGRDGSKLDGIIGVTPTVIEKLIEITGPLEVGGKKFDSATFTENLEYHVEYGFKDAGEDVAERKAIIGDLAKTLFKKITSLPPWKWQNFLSLFLNLTKEKQIMIYSNDEEIQKIILRSGWAGEVKKTDGDFLMVVDANLASLKTDIAVEKNIDYKIISEGDKLKARVTLTYEHRGSFDWRTTRYRTYTRIYAPIGSKLIMSNGFIDAAKKPSEADVELDLGYAVFGGFFSIEPKEKKSVVLEYYLPERIKSLVDNGLYTLFVQKQLGTFGARLTVDADFGKTDGDGKPIIYKKDTDLKIDREFKFQ